MTSTKKDPVVVVLQLTGGNDYFNTIIPYTDPLYYDNRPVVKYPQDEIIKVDDKIGMAPSMGPLKEMFDQGSMMREFVKWDYELRNADVLETAVELKSHILFRLSFLFPFLIHDVLILDTRFSSCFRMGVL